MAQVNPNIPYTAKDAGANRSLPVWKDFPLSWKLPGTRTNGGYSYTSLGQGRIHPVTGTFDTTTAPREILEYKAETDRHLRGYFALPSVRERLQYNGLIDETGRVPCSLKELNVYRQYVHERNLQRQGQMKELEKVLVYNKKKFISQFEEDRHLYERHKTILDMLEHLEHMRREVATAEKHLQRTQEQLMTLTQKKVRDDDAETALIGEVKERTKTVKRKWKNFERFLNFVEDMEAKYQNQEERRDYQEERKLEKASRRFGLRDYLQGLCMEENNFKDAVMKFEKSRKNDERMAMTDEQYRQFLGGIYNTMLQLRLQTKQAENRLIVGLVQRVVKNDDDYDGSIASISSNELDDISLDSLDERDFNNFMASVISINCNSPTVKMYEEMLGNKLKDKILHQARPPREEELRTKINGEQMWKEFFQDAARQIVDESAKTMAKKIAKRRLIYNYDQPYKNVLYGGTNRRAKAPGVKTISSSLLRKTSTQTTIRGQPKHKSQIKVMQKDSSTGMWLNKAHTCESYVQLLQLRAEEVREGRKPTRMSLEKWNIHDSDEIVRGIRKETKGRIQPSQVRDRKLKKRTSSTHTTIEPINVSAQKGYLPPWAQPPDGMSITSDSLNASRQFDFTSQESLMKSYKARFSGASLLSQGIGKGKFGRRDTMAKKHALDRKNTEEDKQKDTHTRKENSGASAEADAKTVNGLAVDAQPDRQYSNVTQSCRTAPSNDITTSSNDVTRLCRTVPSNDNNDERFERMRQKHGRFYPPHHTECIPISKKLLGEGPGVKGKKGHNKGKQKDDTKSDVDSSYSGPVRDPFLSEIWPGFGVRLHGYASEKGTPQMNSGRKLKSKHADEEADSDTEEKKPEDKFQWKFVQGELMCMNHEYDEPVESQSSYQELENI